MRSREIPATPFQLGMVLGNAIPMWVRVCMVSVSFISFALWSMGLLPVFGHGFAKADDVTAIKSDLDETSISTLRAQECHLSSGLVKQFYTDAILKRQQEYKRLTGTDFPLPSCQDE